MKERKKKIFSKYSITLFIIIVFLILIIPYLTMNRFDADFSVIIGQVTIAFIAVIIYYILEAYIFTEDDKKDKLFKKLIIVCLTALTLILFQWIKPVPNLEKKFMVLIPRNKHYTNIYDFSMKLNRSNQQLSNRGYDIMANVEAWYFDVLKDKNYNPDQIGIDNLEFAIWFWLSNKYGMHWSRKSEMFYGISGGHSVPGSFRKKDDVDKIINYSDIKKLLISNQILPENCIDYSGLSLPENSEIKIITHVGMKREYIIGNKYYSLKIIIQQTGTSDMDYHDLGETIKKTLKIDTVKITEGKEEDNHLYCDDILVELSCSFSSLWKGTEEQQKQMEWIQDLMNGLEMDFSWEKLRPEVEKAYGM